MSADLCPTEKFAIMEADLTFCSMIPVSYTHLDVYKRQVITEAQQKGYVVTLVFFWLKMPELAVERVKLRVEAGGHYVPEATIRRRYDVGIRNLFNLYIPVCDYWIMIDNSKDVYKRQILTSSRRLGNLFI